MLAHPVVVAVSLETNIALSIPPVLLTVLGMLRLHVFSALLPGALYLEYMLTLHNTLSRCCYWICHLLPSDERL
jgi:hypothetical protein